ncbi:adenosylcobinamide-GDP ribazoletransferase [Oxyplasma meridianum]|uniref:Adenosylcobinamide-GDP ribazoletransferase n=1 Tax=Oxyplasma meridianum TaxID=3073602 RepID=A0AAX4NGJ3_9ARCH
MPSFRNAISFFTVIPSGSSQLDEKSVYFFSLVGGVVGTLIAAVISVFYFAGFRYEGYVVGFACIIILYGFTHLDGVIDTGDALMFRGTVERRREILKDHYIGAGAIGWVIVIYSVSLASFLQMGFYQAILAVIFGEIFSKSWYVMYLSGSESFGSGLAHFFEKEVRKRKSAVLVANIAPFIFIALFLDVYIAIAFAVTSLILIGVARQITKKFEGVNGDILGFTGELFRMFFYASFLFLGVFPQLSVLNIHLI